MSGRLQTHIADGTGVQGQRAGQQGGDRAQNIGRRTVQLVEQVPKASGKEAWGGCWHHCRQHPSVEHSQVPARFEANAIEDCPQLARRKLVHPVLRREEGTDQWKPHI